MQWVKAPGNNDSSVDKSNTKANEFGTENVDSVPDVAVSDANTWPSNNTGWNDSREPTCEGVESELLKNAK